MQHVVCVTGNHMQHVACITLSRLLLATYMQYQLNVACDNSAVQARVHVQGL